jgi:site-specific DNA recombinase
MQTITKPRSPTQTSIDSAPKRTARAVLYLRVSSPSQVRTDYDPEGLSIPAQRQACERKAAALGLGIVRQYVEPGVSGGSLIKRKSFRQMIADIRELQDVDCVIVWSVSRWARDQEDHWTARGMINRAGAKLISVKEPIGGNGSSDIVVEGVMAAVAAGRRIEISEDVTQGIRRKVEVGGTPTRAPLGYINTGEPLPNGGEVRIVVIDEVRAPAIRWAFETYATGLYSINDMVTLLAAQGLLTRGNRRYPSRPLKHSSVYQLLSNPFYAGKVPYKGKVYPGRHTELVSEELFDQVQAVLKAHNQSGERDRKHAHYLKGSIFCQCNHRLTFSRNKGNGGFYEYFVCPLHQRRTCPERYQRVEAVEAAVEEHYRTINLSDHDQERVRAAIEQHLAKLATTSTSEIDRCQSVLTGLKLQERKLLAKHYADDISDELFHEEAERIKGERIDAEAIIERLSLRHEDLVAGLALALKLASSDLHGLYLRASPTIRRLMNQAIFAAIWVWNEDHVRAELASPFKELAAISRATAGPALTVNADDQAPDAWETSADLVVGSISFKMVGETGSKSRTSQCLRAFRHAHPPRIPLLRLSPVLLIPLTGDQDLDRSERRATTLRDGDELHL